ncbi:glutathione S-transferase [Azoarcus sp. TTM-91]|uniref:MAPEG family protein n=1 Tax=Azoarcus sp. TTM-91 TaxID=2691581 RepID=UPI00145E05F0|nr:MAPEG family protein [Azoarcus sp. TTM-91]NMG37534.1 glutathione S-transferase [Azoarcus sp. TTM-91]
MYPALTAFYGALLGILFVALSLWVSMARASHRVHHGDGGHDDLQRRIRSQANFAEYVPLTLLLIGMAEVGGIPPAWINALLLALLLARLAHPFGMTAREGSPRQYALRGLGMLVTWAVILIAAVLLLLR